MVDERLSLSGSTQQQIPPPRYGMTSQKRPGKVAVGKRGLRVGIRKGKGVGGWVVASVQQVRLWFVYRSTVADAGSTVARLGAAGTLIW